MLRGCPQQLQIHHPIIIPPTLPFPVLLHRWNICLQISLFTNLNFIPPPEAYLFTVTGLLLLCGPFHGSFLDSLARCPISFGILPVPPLRDQDLILIPTLALYTTQYLYWIWKGSEISSGKKKHRKMINPLYQVQRDTHTTPSSLKKSL